MNGALFKDLVELHPELSRKERSGFYRQIFIDERSLGLSNRVRTAVNVTPLELPREHLLMRLQQLDALVWKAFGEDVREKARVRFERI